jgi:hypothetical protein
VSLVLQDPPDHKVPRVFRVFKDRKDRLGLRVPRVHKEPLASRAPLVRLDHKVIKVVRV